ncbi:MAG: hypothetical protein AAF901_09640 [Bacteroidota bacterium]
MKNQILIITLSLLVFSCDKRKEQLLNQKVKYFQVSECRNDCGVDSIGFSTYIVGDNLSVKLGYIVNCSWDGAFLKGIIERNDTLIVKLDRPNNNGEYPITDCDCFYFFDFIIEEYTKKPEVVRVTDLFEKDKFWDERNFDKFREVEEAITNIK